MDVGQQIQFAGLDLPPPSPADPRPRCKLCGGSFARARVAHQRATAPERDYAAEWARFAATRPGAIAKIVACALRLAQRPGHVAIAKVWEDCRGRVGVELNNNLRAPAARYLMATHRALAGRFAVRDAAGDPARRAK